jgi:hypothetical protein
MDEHATEVALWRYGIIAPLPAPGPGRGPADPGGHRGAEARLPGPGEGLGGLGAGTSTRRCWKRRWPCGKKCPNAARGRSSTSWPWTPGLT